MAANIFSINNKKRVIPGFGLSMGITITLLSLVVIIPMASLVINSSGISYSEFINVVTSKAVSYTHLTLPTNSVWCRSRWSPYH